MTKKSSLQTPEPVLRQRRLKAVKGEGGLNISDAVTKIWWVSGTYWPYDHKAMAILFPFLSKLITLMCLSIGTPKNNKFSICTKWKIYYF